MRSLKLLFFGIIFYVDLAYAPPPAIVLCWVGDRLTTTCDNETPLPDGTEVSVCLDWNGDGYDLADPVVAAFDFAWEAQGFPWLYCSATVDLEADLHYVRVSLPEHCWVSGDFQVEGNSSMFELGEWTCYPRNCLQSAPDLPTVLRFAGCLANLGCPCEYPLRMPEGTQVELLKDLTADGPTADDSVASSFALACGSGLPPWDGFWRPLPEANDPPGDFYVRVRSAACCWISAYLDLTAADTVMVADTAWGCAADCRPFDCMSPPAAPQDLVAFYADEMVRLRWYYAVHILNFFVYMDGDFLMAVPGFLRFWGYYAPPGLHTFYVRALTECGLSEPGASDTVWVPGQTANAVAPLLPAGDGQTLSLKTIPRLALEIAPNPFNARTTLSFDMAQAGRVELGLHDMLGRRVALLVEGEYPTGTQQLAFDAGALPAGIYFVRLVTAQRVETRKLLVLK